VKRKDYNNIINKIVNVEEVISRGQRLPSLELNFKENGFNKLGGHTVYIDFKCAKELVEKLQSTIRVMESKYYPNEFYNRLFRSAEEILCR